eukprot:s3627_g6.t1
MDFWHFWRNGHRYLTSSFFVANTFRNHQGPSFSKDYVAELVQAVENQFHHDLGKGNVIETMAAETTFEDEAAVDGEGSDADSEEATGAASGQSDVVIPTAVRQAVRRLHENTGHRSPQRLNPSDRKSTPAACTWVLPLVNPTPEVDPRTCKT